MPKTLYNSSTPIKPNFDPVSKHSSNTIDCTMNYEKILPGIYLTTVKDLCSPDDLKIYGFTHIIYIDKHIITQNRVPNGNNVANVDHENVIKNAETSITASITIRHTNSIASSVSCVPSCCSNSSSSSSSNSCCSNVSNNGNNANGTHSMNDRSPCSSKSTVTTSACSASMLFNGNEMPVDDEPSMKHYASNENLLGHSDFETLDLNFGESSYFTANVLPNCYKAVAFIENALKNNGAVLVIDCIGEHQKCITIVIGFLMYKYNKNFL